MPENSARLTLPASLSLQPASRLVVRLGVHSATSTIEIALLVGGLALAACDQGYSKKLEEAVIPSNADIIAKMLEYRAPPAGKAGETVEVVLELQGTDRDRPMVVPHSFRFVNKN